MSPKGWCWVFFLLLIVTNVVAAPVVTIKTPDSDQSNNRLVLITINSTTFDALQAINTVIYNWNGTNYTYTTPIIVEMPFGQQTITVWANQTDGNMSTVSRTFTISLIVTGGLAIMVGLLGLLGMVLFFAKALDESAWFIKNILYLTGLSLGLIVSSFAVKMIEYQYADASAVANVQNAYLIVVVLMIGMMTWLTIWTLWKTITDVVMDKEAKRQFKKETDLGL